MCGEVIEEPFQTAWHGQDQLAARRRAGHRPGVRYPARQVDEVTRASGERLVSAPNPVLPSEYEERLAFPVMDVQWSTVPGRCVAEQQSELALRLVRTGQDAAARARRRCPSISVHDESPHHAADATAAASGHRRRVATCGPQRDPSPARECQRDGMAVVEVAPLQGEHT